MRRFRGRRRRLLAAITLPVAAAAAFPAAISVAGASSPGAQIATTERAVPSGHTVPVRGRGLEPGESASIRYSPAGTASASTVATVRAGSDGTFSRRVRVTRSGTLRVRTASGQATDTARVTVRNRVRTRATRHLNAGGRARVAGTVRPARRGLPVRVEVHRGGRWRIAGRTRTRADGRFATRVRMSRPGRYQVRVRAGADREARAARSPRTRTMVYRRAVASYYGPGLYGNRTACGGTLTPGTVGVAHRTLPCGTRVTFRYRGRTARLRVIDRGPFHAGREWDLTAAAKNRLGFGSTGVVQTDR